MVKEIIVSKPAQSAMLCFNLPIRTRPGKLRPNPSYTERKLVPSTGKYKELDDGDGDGDHNDDFVKELCISLSQSYSRKVSLF